MNKSSYNKYRIQIILFTFGITAVITLHRVRLTKFNIALIIFHNLIRYISKCIDKHGQNILLSYKIPIVMYISYNIYVIML